MPPQSAELKVNDQPNCPSGQAICAGSTEGMDVIIFDTAGHWDTFTITHVQDSAGHLQHRGQDLNYAYDAGASVTQVVDNTFYLNRTTNQLMKYDGHATGRTAGRQRRGSEVSVLRRSQSADAAETSEPGVANCLYDAAGNYINPPVLTATDGSLAELTAGDR